MSTSHLQRELAPLAVLPPVRPAPRPAHGLLRFGRATLGWAWRLFAGAVLCFNVVLSYFTAILVVGWTYRWMQAVVLKGWWKQSPRRNEVTFEQFCDSLGPGAPVPRPRWFLMERIRATLERHSPTGRPPSAARRVGRALLVPWHSLWLNFKTGLAGLFCTYLLTGWGCLLMLISWEYGWLNSFNRHYESAFVGPLTGLLGSLLLILALFYVPMAQAHMAATGQARAFFEFRFVRHLVRARLTAYVLLAALIGLVSLVMGFMLAFTVAGEFPGNSAPTAEQGLQFFAVYLFGWTLVFLFPAWLVVHYVAAVIYRSAVLKLLRQGTVTRADLHPNLARWLDALGLRVVPRLAPVGLTWYARLTARFAYRRVMFAVLFLVWVVFVARFYVQYFFRADPVVGFLNHPMIQLPAFDFIPAHLRQGRDDTEYIVP